MWSAIASSTKRPFWRVLYGLGVRFVGAQTAQLLASEFADIDALGKFDDVGKVLPGVLKQMAVKKPEVFVLLLQGSVEEAKQRATAERERAVAQAVNAFLQQDLLGQADIGNQTLLAGTRLPQRFVMVETQTDLPSGTVLLVDNSESLKQRDRRRSAEDRLRVAIVEGRVSPQASLKEAAGTIPKDVTQGPARIDLVRAALANTQLHLLEDLRRNPPREKLAPRRR